VVARSPEVWGMRVVPVVRVFRMIFGPFAWAIDQSLSSVVPHSTEAATADGTEQILRIVESEQDEPIEEEERQMIRGIIDMEDTTAREIMVPRIDVIALDEDAVLDEALRTIVERGFSRVPIYRETIDNVTGIIYAKDLLRCLTENRRPALTEVARPPYFIPESKKVDELLAELRKRGQVRVPLPWQSPCGGRRGTSRWVDPTRPQRSRPPYQESASNKGGGPRRGRQRQITYPRTGVVRM